MPSVTAQTPALSSPVSRADTDKSARFWGLFHGFIGMAIFSGSLPATRLAVLDLDPLFVTVGRALIAGLLGGICLLVTRQRRPTGSEWARLAIVAGGVVVGFPLFTAFALRFVPSAHTIVFIGILPLATSLFGVIRAGEHPRPLFWPFAILGSLAVAGYAFIHAKSGFAAADFLMLGAVIVCGLGYAEGSRLAKTLGSWQVICWALVLALPVMAPLILWVFPPDLALVEWRAWAGFAYVSLFSMLIGFFFWYRGLSLGGIARVSQLQLFQPFLGLASAALLLGETVTPDIAGVALVVVACVAAARRYG
jgi:drug/metabolite transporter (DMT)-like permease